MKKLSSKHYLKPSATCGNDNIQYRDQKQSEMNSAIIADSGAHTLIDDKFIKRFFNRNSVANIKFKMD